ncbi:MAG: Mur ligase family protein, partial [Oligoflexia bacterium]|nr:Mur ligase family protein [Oligoflexia bacterium]
LSQDHLDYHGSMENYWLAKKNYFFKPSKAKIKIFFICSIKTIFTVIK